VFLEKCLNFYIQNRNLVVHCGGHKGQEDHLYENFGFQKVIWIEAIPELADFMKTKFGGSSKHEVINTALWSSSNEQLDFHLSSNSKASSSILKMKHHKNTFPEVHVVDVIKIKTKTLDEVMSNQSLISLLLLDLQGAELEVLKGATEALKISEHVFVEVSLTELYSDQALFSEILKFLHEHGFLLRDFDLVEKSGHGNALFSKNSMETESFLDTLKKINKLESQFTRNNKKYPMIAKSLYAAFGVRHFLLARGVPIRLMRRPRFLVKREKLI
jgi:FkbM family methyltransferase